jgi:hypothetical protein
MFALRLAAPPSRPRDRPLSAARCARRPRQWREHRAHHSCARCLSRTLAPVLKAWAVRPPHTRRPPPTSLPGAGRARRRSPPPSAAGIRASCAATTAPSSPRRPCGTGAASQARVPATSSLARPGRTPESSLTAAGCATQDPHKSGVEKSGVVSHTTNDASARMIPPQLEAPRDVRVPRDGRRCTGEGRAPVPSFRRSGGRTEALVA